MASRADLFVAAELLAEVPAQVVIRHGVKPGELDALYDLEARVYPEDMLWGRGEFKRLARKGLTWVAEDDGVPVGLMIITVRRGVPYIDTIEVAPEARGKGIAGALMALGEEAVKDKGFDEIHLEVGSDNLAKNLYLKKGYTIVQEKKDYYSKGHHALVMAKPL